MVWDNSHLGAHSSWPMGNIEWASATNTLACNGLHFEVDRSLQVVEDLHHSITDFWSNSISRDHSDRLGLGIAR